MTTTAENQYCCKPSCGNLAISFSEFCGEHSNSAIIRKRLREFPEKEFKALNLNALTIKDITFEDKLFDQAKLDSCEFRLVKFVNCEFDLAHFVHVTFDLVRFENCKFIRLEANDTTWMNCSFIGCTFQESQFIQCTIDEGKLAHCKFETTEFNGQLFTDIEEFSFCNFELCIFIQASFNRVYMFASTLDNSELNKSTLHDSSFINCIFKDSANDFKQTGAPILCHFNGAEFTNFYLPRSIKRWNNFDLSPPGFYRRIVRLILNMTEDANDSLSELTLALSHLDRLGYRSRPIFNAKLNEFFANLIRASAQNADYEQAGEIIGEYGKVPERYRTKSSFFLPPPATTKPVKSGHVATLILQVQLDDWKLQSVSRLFNLLAALERQLPLNTTQTLTQLAHGSLISVFWGDIKQLVMTGRLLDVEKLEIDVDKSAAELEKTNLDIYRQKIELSTLEEDKILDKQIKEQNLEALKLSNFEKKLDLLDRLEKRYGLDTKAFSTTPEGQAAAAIAAELRAEFPIIKLRIEDNEENTNR